MNKLRCHLKFAEVIESKPFGLTAGGGPIKVPAKSRLGTVGIRCQRRLIGAWRLHA
jgi:hypothetical protein